MTWRRSWQREVCWFGTVGCARAVSFNKVIICQFANASRPLIPFQSLRQETSFSHNAHTQLFLPTQHEKCGFVWCHDFANSFATKRLRKKCFWQSLWTPVLFCVPSNSLGDHFLKGKLRLQSQMMLLLRLKVRRSKAWTLIVLRCNFNGKFKPNPLSPKN